MGELGRTFLIVGVLGGFTTFSSLGLDTFTLMRGGQAAMALANVAAHLVLGLGAVWAGFVIASWRG
jgi:CrcB protein